MLSLLLALFYWLAIPVSLSACQLSLVMKLTAFDYLLVTAVEKLYFAVYLKQSINQNKFIKRHMLHGSQRRPVARDVHYNQCQTAQVLKYA